MSFDEAIMPGIHAGASDEGGARYGSDVPDDEWARGSGHLLWRNGIAFKYYLLLSRTAHDDQLVS